MRLTTWGTILVTVLATVACSGAAEKNVNQVTPEEVALDQQTLDELRKSGSDLSKPHQVEFFLYIPVKPDAEAAAAELRGTGYTVTLRLGADKVNWLCLGAKTLVPTIQGLTDARKVFKGLAIKFKGEYDGWDAAVQQ